MRMRKKKNLEARLDKCSDFLIECVIGDLNFKNAERLENLLDYEMLFGNSNPVVLEIGCGKGAFACAFAERHPDINVIAVEKVANVIVSACEEAMSRGLKNIKFMKCRAEYLPSYIAEKSITRIFLNFSCPFPKAKYAKHRLTHGYFLNIYKKLMTDGAVICQKTDNMSFFEFSIESFSANGFILSSVTLDLHNSTFEDNIVTEYEERFASQGKPIYRLEARLGQ